MVGCNSSEAPEPHTPIVINACDYGGFPLSPGDTTAIIIGRSPGVVTIAAAASIEPGASASVVVHIDP